MPIENTISTPSLNEFTVWTDGACEPNPGVGGWAAIVVGGGRELVLRGSEPTTTNNRMEMTAALEGLRAVPAGTDVTVVSDSQYVVNGMTKWVTKWSVSGWTRGRKAERAPVLNADLWQQLAAEAGVRRVSWRWVRGHNGDPMNERCDRLAVWARIARGRAMEGRRPWHRSQSCGQQVHQP